MKKYTKKEYRALKRTGGRKQKNNKKNQVDDYWANVYLKLFDKKYLEKIKYDFDSVKIPWAASAATSCDYSSAALEKYRKEHLF